MPEKLSNKVGFDAPLPKAISSPNHMREQANSPIEIFPCGATSTPCILSHDTQTLTLMQIRNFHEGRACVKHSRMAPTFRLALSHMTLSLTYGFLFRHARRRRDAGRHPRRAANHTWPRRLHVGRHPAESPRGCAKSKFEADNRAACRPLTPSVSQAAVMKGTFMTRTEDGRARDTAHRHTKEKRRPPRAEGD